MTTASTPDVSVIVCTHSPRADYLASTVAGLRAQTLPADRWELLVVDNASAPGREPTADITWHPAGRVVREDTLGLTHARLRGIREAAGALLVFVDDDNVLDADYLAAALRVADDHAFLGSWSGACRPRFDEPAPEWTRPYWDFLALRDVPRDVWSNLPRQSATMPCGAGLCVRREVARRYLSLHDSGGRRFVLDRAGDSLVSGGDNDLAACACDAGLGVGLFGALRLQHLIPPERLTADYLSRLIEGIHFSSILLDAERGVSPSLPTAAQRVLNRLQILRRRGPHRTILAASRRGEARARALLASLPPPA